MKWTFAGLGAIIAGIFGFVMIDLFNNVTVTNENEYYLLKEVTEASMIDAIDIAYYRRTGELKIVKEKFIESFLGRYADAITYSRGNKFLFEFYDIMESPPKVSIIAKSNTGVYNIFEEGTDFSIENALTAILEYGEGCWVERELTMFYILTPWDYQYPYVKKHSTYTPELKRPDFFELEVGKEVKDVKVAKDSSNNFKINYIGPITTQTEIDLSYGQYTTMYKGSGNGGLIYDIPGLQEKYLAEQFSLIGNLRYNEDENRVYFDANYKCSSDDTRVYDRNGRLTCIFGVMFEITWSYKVYANNVDKKETCIKE